MVKTLRPDLGIRFLSDCWRLSRRCHFHCFDIDHLHIQRGTAGVAVLTTCLSTVQAIHHLGRLDQDVGVGRTSDLTEGDEAANAQIQVYFVVVDP
jgi:hypothetical protein